MLDIFFYFFSFLMWISFWSFASVFVSRIKKNEKWIVLWRSHCTSCNNTLNHKDLVPIFSYLFLKWKCRYCKSKISFIYPLLEITTGILFLVFSMLFINIYDLINWNIYEIIKLFYLFFIAFIIISISFYDIEYLEVSNKIIYPWIIWTILFIFIWMFFNNWINNFLFNNNFENIVFSNDIKIIWMLFSITILLFIKFIYDYWNTMLKDLLIFIISYSIFFLLIHIFWKEILTLSIINSIVWWLISFSFIYLLVFFTNWKWMWFWDTSIALLLWLILWYSYFFYWLLLSFLTWSLFLLPYYIFFYIKYWKRYNKSIPFWPFLMLWMVITLILIKNNYII